MTLPSSQPRFKNKMEDPSEFFMSTLNLLQDLEDDPEPQYQADSKLRDAWLIRFVNREPHLSGVISSVTAIDKNRGWSVVGGRNQVNRVTQMLHSFECAPGLTGWRPAFAATSEAFWNTDMGGVVEIGRDGRGGPITKLFTVDPTRCQLTGNMDTPLKYYPTKGGKVQKWSSDDYFRVSSLPSLLEGFNGLGRCAVSRAVQIALTMIALLRHDQEKLLARAPRGLLLLSGIKQKQWADAMAARDAQLDSQNDKYFGAVAVLASSAASVDAKLVALSELPVSFNLREFMDMTMYGYSLCFGYDPSEFWPVQYGALGRGNETQIQHEKATGKGRLDFVLGFQEQLSNFLPDSIDFTMEQRDDQGDLLHASVDQAWANVAKTMYTSKLNGIPLITNEEARVLLAQYGVIPTTWSPTAEVAANDIEDSDDEPVVDQPEDMPKDTNSPDSSTGGRSPDSTGQPASTNPDKGNPAAQSLQSVTATQRMRILRDQLLESPRVWQAARKFPNDPVVQYNYPANTQLILWESGAELLKPRVWKNEFISQGKNKEKEVAKTVFQPQIHITMPQQEYPSPVVQVTVPTPIVNVTVPEQKFPEIPVPVVHYHAPTIKQDASPAPIVNFNPVINVPPAEVTVNVPAPVVNIPESTVNVVIPKDAIVVNNTISMPDETGKETFKVSRGPDGKISGVEKTSD